LFIPVLSIGMLTLMIIGSGVCSSIPEAAPTLQQPSVERSAPLMPEENKEQLAAVDDILLLSNKQPDSDMYQGITIQTNHLSRTFAWANVRNETYYPTVHLADVNSDGADEIIVLLTEGTGTGVFEHEIHVLNKESLHEIPIDNPIEYVNAQVTSHITQQEGKVKVIIEYGGNRLEKTYDQSYAGSWNEEVYWGMIVKYEISNNRITAIIPGSVSPAEFAATAMVSYGSDLKAKHLEIIEGD
jgi:hypothetical protein